jgi:hypothetical protein
MTLSCNTVSSLINLIYKASIYLSFVWNSLKTPSSGYFIWPFKDSLVDCTLLNGIFHPHIKSTFFLSFQDNWHFIPDIKDSHEYRPSHKKIKF